MKCWEINQIMEVNASPCSRSAHVKVYRGACSHLVVMPAGMPAWKPEMADIRVITKIAALKVTHKAWFHIRDCGGMRRSDRLRNGHSESGTRTKQYKKGEKDNHFEHPPAHARILAPPPRRLSRGLIADSVRKSISQCFVPFALSPSPHLLPYQYRKR